MIANILTKLQLRHKLIIFNLLISGIVVMIASAISLVTEFISFRNSMLDNLSSQARILAGNSTAALSFNDQKTAAEMLSALKLSSDIECAAIYAGDGSVFATYQRPGEKEKLIFPPPQIDGPFITGKHLQIFQGIVLDRDRIGTIYIRSNIKRLDSLMMIYGATSVVSLLATFVIACLLLSRWQKVITEPILDLSRVMSAVSRDKNYSLKAKVYTEDEIGSLAQGFNEMLAQIRQRDALLLTEIVERKRAADELKNANSRGERLLRFSEALLSAIPTPVFYKDVDGRYLGCNHAFSEITGITADQLTGKTVMELWQNEVAETYHKKDLELMANSARQNFDFNIRDKDGRERTVIFIRDVFHDENGAVAGIVGAFLDITERKEAEERLKQAKEEWERTFDAIVDPVMIADSEHRILKINKAMADKLGISPEDAEGLACFNAVHGADEPPLLCPHTDLLADGQAHSVEIHEERLGGYFIVSVSPLFTPRGDVYGSVHYARDITKRKQAEEAVRRLNEELECKVEERTSQLLEAQEELVRKEKLSILGQLSGSVGHELRNPLGVMSNAIYFLKMVHVDADETTKEYLDIIKHEIDNSQRIITDLLDFARTKPPQKRSVAVRELVEESLQRCKFPENVDIQRDIPDALPHLKIDPFQVGQVFQNLISNGIQAMPNGGAISISARAAQVSGSRDRGCENNLEHGTLKMEPGGDFVEINIRDSGEGISPENMKKLFHPLFTTKAKGIGLGLTVCKNLTEANGGRIEVESVAGKGTKFTILLPMEG